MDDKDLNEKRDDFEESAKKAVQKEEGTTDVEYEEVMDEKEIQPDASAYSNIGKLGKASTYRKDDDSSEMKNIRDRIGYVNLMMENLPSKGKFYSHDTKISIRAARVEEIREFSTLEETNLFDVDDKFNNILVSCCRVDIGNSKGSYKDILEEDRIFVILSIKELTFVKGENKLTHKAVCSQCDTENTYEFKTNNLQYHDSHEELSKYLSEEHKCYVIPTKNSGTLRMAPPNIGVMKAITKMIKEKEEKKEKWDKSFFQTLPYYQLEWRGLDEKKIFDKQVEFQSWSTIKYSTVFRLAEKMKIGVKPELLHPCEKCGAEVSVPITFRGGLKSIFVISDTTGELL